MLSFGVALTEQKSRRFECRWKLRFYTALYDDRTVGTDRLGDIQVEGGERSGVMLSAGVIF